jgi:chromosome partitioning protein
VVFRELFPRGLTALDTLDRKTLGSEPTVSHVAARDEIRTLIDALRLPTVSGEHPPDPRRGSHSGGARRSGSPPLRAAR